MIYIKKYQNDIIIPLIWINGKHPMNSYRSCHHHITAFTINLKVKNIDASELWIDMELTKKWHTQLLVLQDSLKSFDDIQYNTSWSRYILKLESTGSNPFTIFYIIFISRFHSLKTLFGNYLFKTKTKYTTVSPAR